MVVQKMHQKSYHVYPPEIVQTNSVGRLQKKSSEHKLFLSISQQKVRKPPNGQHPQSIKLLSNKLLKSYSNVFKKHWNNTGTIRLNIILQTWDMFLNIGLTELHMFFITRSTTFFTSTVFIIFRLVFFLIRRLSSEGVL